MATTAAQKNRHAPSGEPVGGLAPDEAEPIVLTARDWEVFLTAWDDLRPRPHLEALIKQYRNTPLSDVG